LNSKLEKKMFKLLSKIFKNLIFFTSITVFFYKPVFSDSLEMTVKNAITNNLEFLNAKSELFNLKEDIIQTKEKKKLSVTGFLNTGKSWDFKCESDLNSCVDNSFTGGLTNTYSLFDGGIIDSEIKSNQLNYEIKKFIISDLENDLIYNVILAYLNVLTDRKLIELSKKNIEVLNQQFQAAQSRFALGEITQTDVSQASASLAGAESIFSEKIGSLTLSDLNFESLVGYKPKMLSDINSLPTLPKTLESAITKAKENNPKIKVANLRISQSKLLLEIAEKGPFLSLNLTSDIIFGNNKNSNFSSADIMLEGSIPLNSNKRFLSEEKEAKNKYLIALSTYNIIQKNIVRSVISAWSNLQVTSSLVKSREKEYMATSLLHQGLKEETSLGLRPLLDVFNSEKLLFDSKFNLEKAQKDYLLAQYNLLKHIGILNYSKL